MPVISAGEPITPQNTAQPHPAASVNRSPIVKRIGYCFLTEKQLDYYNKIKLISDEELATVDMQLGSPFRAPIQEAPNGKALAQGIRILAAQQNGDRPAAGAAIDPQETPLPQPKQQPHPAASVKRLPKTIRIGYCFLTEKQLEHYKKLELISDEELEAVERQRSLKIDEFPVAQERFQVPPPPHNPVKDRSEQVKELRLRLGMRPHKTYKLQLLNQLVRIIDTEPDPKAIIPELQLDFMYLENEEVRQLPPHEREYRRLDAFYDYLDEMYVNGNGKKAIDLVVNGFIRLNNRRLQVSQNGFISPRSFDLIPTQLQK
ncbi:hypothetical protein KR059_007857 [Drosophila kikkawai]|nr:hypothetical protein KR059_007857 [Drosophila kikkawai]